MLSIKNIYKTYSKEGESIQVLNDFSLELQKGDFAAIHGPSGCGKTTLLLLAGGLLHPDKGDVRVNNQDIFAMNADKRSQFRAKNIGFVFQQYHLIPYLNVLENIQVPALAQNLEVDKKNLKELISILGLSDRVNHTPGELSAGEKQRTALARALLFSPSLLLADEITGNLDEENVEIVLNTLYKYQEKGGTIALVTHDKNLGQKAGITLELRKQL